MPWLSDEVVHAEIVVMFAALVSSPSDWIERWAIFRRVDEDRQYQDNREFILWRCSMNAKRRRGIPTERAKMNLKQRLRAHRWYQRMVLDAEMRERHEARTRKARAAYRARKKQLKSRKVVIDNKRARSPRRDQG